MREPGTMIRVLRHMGVLLWMTSLVSVPLTFYVLPGLASVFSGINPITTGLAIVTGIAAAFGFLMDWAARKSLMALIKEAEAWERSGILNRAGKNYTRALRIYDSFLVWPFLAKKITHTLAFSIAKFNMSTATGNSNFNPATLFYLRINPDDEDIALLWLARLKQAVHVTPSEQEVLSVLVERHTADPRFSGLMADICLKLERKDYIAKRLYQHVAAATTVPGPGGETIDLKQMKGLINTPETSLQHELSSMETLREYAQDPGEPFNKKPDKNFEKKPGRKIKIYKIIRALAQMVILGLKRLSSGFGSGVLLFILSAGRLVAWIRMNERTGLVLKMGFFGIISVCFLWFMVNTLSHMLQSKTPEKEAIIVQDKVRMPFTIQVAAYLKQIHADRYVDSLRKRQIEADVKRTEGGGKTWFVVRVSQFADKKSAAAYGLKLKQQGLIDDFFVNNR